MAQPIVFAKVAISSATAMGLVDIASQMFEKGMCYGQKPRRYKQPLQHGAGSDEEGTAASSSLDGGNCLCPGKWDSFEINVASTLRTATLGGVIGSVMFGGTLLFMVHPVLYAHTAVSAIATTTVCALPFAYYNSKPNFNAQHLRQYLVPALIGTLGTTYVATYVLGSVVYGHRILVWPMASSLGELSPENVIFTVGYSATSVMYALAVNAIAVSRKQWQPEELDERRNLATRLGYTAALGLMGVALFPAMPHQPGMYPHYAGAATFLLCNIPFFYLTNNMGVKDDEQSDAETVEAARRTRRLRNATLAAYTVAAITYPSLWPTYKIGAAMAETTAGIMFCGLVGSYHHEVQECAAIAAAPGGCDGSAGGATSEYGPYDAAREEELKTQFKDDVKAYKTLEIDD